jgi:hypothetical protein
LHAEALTPQHHVGLKEPKPCEIALVRLAPVRKRTVTFAFIIGELLIYVVEAPLHQLICRQDDAGSSIAVQRDIARESSKGRVLLIGTTDLDAQRPVLWDMGRIAENDSLEALELFRKVLLASATLPGVFAPVRIKVRVGGKDYDELHVDGGVTRQVFIAPSIIRLVSDHASRRTVNGGRLYVIRNGRIDPRWEPVNNDVLSVTQRSLSTLIKNQGIGDLYRIYSIAKLDGIDLEISSKQVSKTLVPRKRVPAFAPGGRRLSTRYN